MICSNCFAVGHRRDGCPLRKLNQIKDLTLELEAKYKKSVDIDKEIILIRNVTSGLEKKYKLEMRYSPYQKGRAKNATHTMITRSRSHVLESDPLTKMFSVEQGICKNESERSQKDNKLQVKKEK
ncbi:9094_t:CDS:1 [Acaulospora morrowiae]|uniref:9094_t:CDS:1 n=1 Tax=Acaulospora morrowiae TaxID=94023 RepID=A0A9N9AEK5_9GLOM|nr:9094_t:CDS:1 [Acaulospora morrowiae]